MEVHFKLLAHVYWTSAMFTDSGMKEKIKSNIFKSLIEVPRV